MSTVVSNFIQHNRKSYIVIINDFYDI